MDKLPREFYLQDTLTAARELIGTYLVRSFDNGQIAGRITETEAYIGTIDKACHAYGGKRTPRTKIMFGPGGYSYIYFIYGMYYCMNVVTEQEGCGSAVLIRGLELVKGVELAAQLRYGKSFESLVPSQLKNISNGPGKLCKAMQLTKEQDGEDLLGETLCITRSLQGIDNPKLQIKTGKRIGIDSAQEARDFPWRFFVNGRTE